MIAELGKGFKMSVFEIINLRSQWEAIAQHLNTDVDSSIQGLKAFVENSHKNNRFKSGWEEAMDIAETILRHAK